MYFPFNILIFVNVPLALNNNCDSKNCIKLSGLFGFDLERQNISFQISPFHESMMILIFLSKQLFNIVFPKCLKWAFLYRSIFILNERLSILTHTKNISLWVWMLLIQEKTLTKIFWLADLLSQANPFSDSSLPLVVEQIFCLETDAITFCVGVTAVTFSVVTMVTWQKQHLSFVLSIQLSLFHFLPGRHSPNWQGCVAWKLPHPFSH